ncbi:sigma-70 family RNA polymerase sigma factor [Microbacterium maritypicum]|uniref:sigma-70 family RNA polymerase sigma factor n=1 Tax=Microbacterium maritypicum TaxID=33918 RepID=UPI003CF3D85B
MTDDDIVATETADTDLIKALRDGDRSAYAELWRRHAQAGTAFARSFTKSFDPDDLVSEAFARILRIIDAGGGPTASFRSYLYTTIRNTAINWQRDNRTRPLGEDEDLPDERSEAMFSAVESSPTMEAFRSLPQIWQEVLWYVDVEGMAAAEIAPLLDVSANSVAARTYRAREGLRQAWIQVQLDTVAEGSDHQWALERMGAHARDALARRDRDRMEKHLSECARCALIASEATEISSRLALTVVPAITGLTGAALAGWIASLNGGAAVQTVAMGVDGLTAEEVARPVDEASKPATTRYVIGGLFLLLLIGLIFFVLPGLVAPPETQPSEQPGLPSKPAPTASSTPAASPSPSPSPSPTAIRTPVEPEAPWRAPLAAPQVLNLTGAPVRLPRPILSGTATAGSSITVRAGGEAVGGTTVGADGRWTLTADLSRLQDGPHQLTVTSSLVGVASASATAGIVVDRSISIPSGIVVTYVPDGVVVSGRADPEAIVTVRGDGVEVAVTAGVDGTWRTSPIAGFPAGRSVLTATAVDAAGNVSPASAPIPVTR